MMRDSHKVLLCVLFAVSCLSVVGCSEAESDLVPVEKQVDVPDQFSDGGVTWNRVTTADESDVKCLSRFFAKRQDLAGSPDIAGEPLVFKSGKSDRRFCWLNATVDGTAWKCVRFERGKFSFTEGAGSPFEQ